MYLRRVLYDDGYHYIIRETHRENGAWRYRDIIDLGLNPADCIRYQGRNGFYFKPEVEEALQALGVEYTPGDLEEIFLPFLKPHIRRIVETLRHAHASSIGMSKACRYEDSWSYTHELHPFDKRRLHYLRFGRVDIGNLDGRPWKFLNVLLCRSRDEIEASIDAMESRLPHREIPRYVYASMNLQSRFPHHLLRHYPEGLDLDKLDVYFMEEICRLNGDKSFFRGMEMPDPEKLHPFLMKYIIFYFDYSFEVENPWNRFFEEFSYQHRFFSRPRQASSVSVKEAFIIMGISEEDFKRMSRREVVRIYWRKAQRKHPDKGGSHEEFVRLTEAYEVLAARK